MSFSTSLISLHLISLHTPYVLDVQWFIHIPGTNGWIVNAPRCATLYNCSFNCTLLVSSSSSNKADTTSRAIPLIDSALMTTHDGNLLDRILVVICYGCLPLEQDLDRVLLRLFLSVYPDCHQLNMTYLMMQIFLSHLSMYSHTYVYK